MGSFYYGRLECTIPYVNMSIEIEYHLGEIQGKISAQIEIL